MATDLNDDIAQLAEKAKVEGEKLAETAREAATALADRTREVAAEAFEKVKSAREALARKLD
jgi:hypothetical protein